MTTEGEATATWLTATELRPMLSLLKGKARERKFKLFACACCRRIDHLLTDERSLRAIEVIEKFHDGLVTRQTYNLAERTAKDSYDTLNREVAADESTSGRPLPRSILLLAHMYGAQSVWMCYKNSYFDVAQLCCGALRGHGTAEVEEAESRSVGESIEVAERAAQADLLRDIFGNPFRPIIFESSWLTSTVIALAHQMYDSRDFSAMPILADALQDAGCENVDILDHCRGLGAHVLGCWVVDLILSK
jgi:hypothetical protein